MSIVSELVLMSQTEESIGMVYPDFVNLFLGQLYFILTSGWVPGVEYQSVW